MEKRIEHYLIRSERRQLTVTQDQRAEMHRAVWLIGLMIVAGVAAGPYGLNVIPEFSYGTFWIWTAGWCVSGGVAVFALNYRKEIVLTKRQIQVRECRSGHWGAAHSIMLDKNSKILLHYRQFTHGPRIGNTPLRLGTRKKKIFPFTITITGSPDREVRFSLSLKASADALLDAIHQVVELEVHSV